MLSRFLSSLSDLSGSHRPSSPELCRLRSILTDRRSSKLWPLRMAATSHKFVRSISVYSQNLLHAYCMLTTTCQKLDWCKPTCHARPACWCDNQYECKLLSHWVMNKWQTEQGWDYRVSSKCAEVAARHECGSKTSKDDSHLAHLASTARCLRR